MLVRMTSLLVGLGCACPENRPPKSMSFRMVMSTRFTVFLLRLVRGCLQHKTAPTTMTGPSPCTLHLTPYTIHPTPYNIHHTPCTLHQTPHTLHHTPCTLQPPPYLLHHTPYTLHPIHATTNTLNPRPYTVHQTPDTLRSTLCTPHLTPYTRHPTPCTSNPSSACLGLYAPKPRDGFRVYSQRFPILDVAENYIMWVLGVWGVGYVRHSSYVHRRTYAVHIRLK